MSIIYTARVDVRGGRSGSVRSEDGTLDAKLAFPTALGGDGQGTNPEQLFAAGYAACFASTVAVMAKNDGVTLEGVEVRGAVDLSLVDGAYGLGVALVVRAPGAAASALEGWVEKAKNACPYSRAVRGNVVTNVSIAS